MSWRSRLANWLNPPAKQADADALTHENPNEIGPKTAVVTEPETPVTKPEWHAYKDKSEYRRDYSRWHRANSKMEEQQNSIAKQLEATRRAEELERQRLQAQQQPPPELSERKKQLFAANPHLRFHTPMLGQLHDHLMNSGVVDDSDHYVDQMAALLDGLGIRFTRPSAAPSGEQQQHSEPEPVHEPEPEPEPSRPNMSNIPISAPVSRSVAGSNGARHDVGGKVTLSAEERHIAHVSITDPTLTNQQKEVLYARGKARYQANPEFRRDGR